MNFNSPKEYMVDVMNQYAEIFNINLFESEYMYISNRNKRLTHYLVFSENKDPGNVIKIALEMRNLDDGFELDIKSYLYDHNGNVAKKEVKYDYFDEKKKEKSESYLFTTRYISEFIDLYFLIFKEMKVKTLIEKFNINEDLDNYFNVISEHVSKTKNNLKFYSNENKRY